MRTEHVPKPGLARAGWTLATRPCRSAPVPAGTAEGAGFHL